MQKLAVVTGITSGIGLAMAQALSAAGFALYGVARNAEKLAALELLMVGSEVCDLAREDDVARCLTGLDLSPWSMAVLVNNAGSLDPIGRFDHIDLATTNATMMLNGLAPIFISKTFYNAVLAAPSCTGRIVQITSGAAHRAIAGWTSYCMSKAAMWMGTQVMAEEMDTSRCQVMALSPGVVATPMQAQIRAETEETMPGVAWFREMAEAGSLAEPAAPAAWLVTLLQETDAGIRVFPHGQSEDLFAG